MNFINNLPSANYPCSHFFNRTTCLPCFVAPHCFSWSSNPYYFSFKSYWSPLITQFKASSNVLSGFLWGFKSGVFESLINRTFTPTVLSEKNSRWYSIATCTLCLQSTFLWILLGHIFFKIWFVIHQINVFCRKVCICFLKKETITYWNQRILVTQNFLGPIRFGKKKKFLIHFFKLTLNFQRSSL